MKRNQLNTTTFKRGSCACEQVGALNKRQVIEVREGKTIHPVKKRKTNSFQSVKSRFLGNHRF